MKIPITIKAAALALAGFVLGALPASAALTYTPGDVLVGFRSGTSVYLVNLGSAGQLTGTAPGATISFGNFANDLAQAYGSTWADLSTLSWGVFSTSGEAPYTLYASRSGSGSGAWGSLTNGNASNTDTQIANVTGAFQDPTKTTASQNGVNGGFQSFTTLGSYYYAVTTGTSDFGSVSGWTSIEANSASGIDNTVLNITRVGSNGNWPSNIVGNFTIDSAGTVYFTAAAVPEPSTYVLLIISGVALVVFVRRRAATKA